MAVLSLVEDWLDRLSYTEFPNELFRPGVGAGTRAYASEIEEMLDPEGPIGASAVFCVEDFPTVCVVDASILPADRDQRVEEIRQRVWNQSLASVVLVLDYSDLSAYSVSSREAEPEVLARSDADPNGPWSAYEVRSGFIKDRLSEWFSPDERVDRKLLANLRQVVTKLLKFDLKDTQAESLVAQVIFLCYLEQRGIVGDHYRSKHALESLESYVVKADGAGVDRLLRQLGSDFNGDFLSSTDGGAPKWSALDRRCFPIVKSFLEAVDVDTGQGSFWRYDFSHIPVELVSGIYETLLKERQDKLGAYYTPRHLANLVTEQALECVQNPASCSVYDGACGSGILLTTAFRRMLRHAEIREGRSLRFSERVALMKSNLFGNDLDETACWITAFSLYLSLLEGLDPSDISLLQSDSNLKLPNLVGEGLNIQKGDRYGDFFSPQNPFASSGRFDVFLCNPPWRESDDDEQPTWEAWCNEQTPPYQIGVRQIASGFAYKALQSVKPDGVIVLIMPLNLIIGATKQSVEFRQRLLEDARVERITNFGDVRRLLFQKAKHPCAVIRVRPRAKDPGIIPLASEYIEYWTPKTDVSLALGRLTLHGIDRKAISSQEVYDRPYALITNYWGERRDVDLIRRLARFGQLKKTMASRREKWTSGKGFHAANNSNPDRELGIIQDLALLSTDEFPGDCLTMGKDSPQELVRDRFSVVASPGGDKGRLYKGPRVLFLDGVIEGRYEIRSVYAEQSFAFTSSIGAIGGNGHDRDLLKFLSAFLRSSLATYFLTMTGYSVIGERPRVAVEDILSFPFCAPESHPDPASAESIVKKVVDIVDSIGLLPSWKRSHAYDSNRKELDSLIDDYFELSAVDRLLVEDSVKYIVKSIQPPDYESLDTPLLHRPNKEEVSRYTRVLAAELSGWRKLSGGEATLRVDVVPGNAKAFFGAVKVSIAEDQDVVNTEDSDTVFKKVLEDLQAGLSTHLEQTDRDDLLKMPDVMVVSNDAFYFIKPMRRRFWMASTALSDADRVVRAVQSAAWDRAYRKQANRKEAEL